MLCFFCRRVNFKAVLARVARARDDGRNAGNLAFAEMGILSLFERSFGQRLQDAHSIRPLQSYLAVVGADVLQLYLLALLMRLNPIPVFLSRPCVDDEQQTLLSEAIDQQVVNDSAFRRGQRRILSLTVNEFRDIIRGQAVDESNGVSAS